MLMRKPKIAVDGALPRGIGLRKSDVKAAAEFFVERSSARSGMPFRSVAIVLQDDAFSAEVHLAVNGVEGPTDAITQGYDPMPRRAGWSAAKELLLYVAHGIDHLSGADDIESTDYDRMRRRELSWLRQLEEKT